MSDEKVIPPPVPARYVQGYVSFEAAEIERLRAEVARLSAEPEACTCSLSGCTTVRIHEHGTHDGDWQAERLVTVAAAELESRGDYVPGDALEDVIGAVLAALRTSTPGGGE